MAIKLNGTEITINRLNGTSITEESINGTKVYPTDVPATAWQYTSPTQDFVQEFEVEMFLSDLQQEGCGFSTSHLPPASNYFVGDVIRGRLNTPSSTCPTWIYYEAI